MAVTVLVVDEPPLIVAGLASVLQPFGDRLEAIFGIFRRVFSFRTAEVTHQNDAAATIEHGLD